jgi:quinolinate synthase
LFYDKLVHTMVETFINAYKNEGNFVICGHYYDLIQHRNMSYYFNDEVKLANICSHLVCASKFVMPRLEYACSLLIITMC